ncbi:hypothetical protein MFLAVUS_008589 [Mucor flavus]|uniref:Cas12f1-like TNB domain-containing protein n=1 Tax=Mucor flavus TaxID=439312 RepID=A0ABP9Z7H9_9FUNG
MSEATFKSIILEKKRQVFESRKANAFEVGSGSGKKRKQTYEDIAQKRRAKRQKDQVEGDVAICSKCKQRGHRSARSPLCPQGILSKAQVIRANLGDNYKAYTRKLGFDNCVSDTYHTKLQSSVIKACSTVKHLVFRAKLFVNYYVLENHALIGAPKVIFSQNFWYSIIQMVNGKRPTNSVSLPQQLLSSFDQFRRQHGSILYTEKILPGISQCVTEACTELATSYTNNIVENFENHLLYFLRYKLQDLFRFMPKKIIGEVAKKYCYQEICKGSPTWPNTELLNNEVKSTIQHFCEPWKNMISKPVTQVKLSANPGNFIPFLMSLNAELEQEHIDYKPYDVRKLPLPRRFFILPKTLFHWRFVTISVNALSCFVKLPLPRDYQAQLKMFFRIFKFEKLRFKDITELAPNGNNSILFGNTVRTDGVSVDFLFYRKHQVGPGPSYQRFDLALEDFDLSEVKDKYLPISLDPGRTSVFTAMVGLQLNRHLRCTTKEYYHMTGSTRFSRKQNKLKKDTGIESLESEIPSPKTSKSSAYSDYVKYMLLNKDSLFGFYEKDAAKTRFQLYRGVQRATDQMANILINGTSKKQKWKPAPYLESKTKISLIIFGAGMFGKDAVKLKGHRCGVVGKVFGTLERREAEGRLIVTTIDEFKTSKTCNLCLSDGLTIIDTDNFKGIGVVCCHHCKQSWQRDINASNNMMTISKAVWSGQGRPRVFTPERNTSP